MNRQHYIQNELKKLDIIIEKKRAYKSQSTFEFTDTSDDDEEQELAEQTFQKFASIYLNFNYECICFDLDLTLINDTSNRDLFPETKSVLDICKQLCGQKMADRMIDLRRDIKIIPMYMLSRNKYVKEICIEKGITQYFADYYITDDVSESKVQCFIRNQQTRPIDLRIKVSNAVLFDDDWGNIRDWYEHGGMPIYVTNGDLARGFKVFYDLVCGNLPQYNKY